MRLFPSKDQLTNFRTSAAQWITLTLGLLTPIAAAIWWLVSLQVNVSQLKEQERALETKMDAMASALVEISKKPATVVNPIQQKCAVLAEQAMTGRIDNDMGSSFGPDITKNAIATMEKLGCGSTSR
jgi:hypothetical protein